MGNQLAGIPPQQIHPVEYYLSEVANSELLSFDANLGSTRFLKVARVKLHQTRPGLASAGSNSNYSALGPPALGVAKVFVIHDPSLPVKYYKDKLDQLQRQLRGNANALPMSKLILSDKAGIMVRQYVKYTLYDRLSTRPFLTFFEKKWITFQLLKCFQWMHRQGICHGDLKLENTLITSNLWVLVSDFAPFKPTTLPDDNPGDFSYFFDTSRRRTCNLAPERFVSDGADSSSPDAQNLVALTPQMDLFSLGCVIAELFSEEPSFELFDLGSLLMYRKSKSLEQFKAKLNSITDDQIRDFVLNLIDIDPAMRNSTTQHLREMTPSVFSNYFNQLFDYLKELTSHSPDDRVNRLKVDFDILKRPIIEEDADGLVLLLTVVTSSLRALKHVHSKITALRLICEIVDSEPSTMSYYVLDRVLPYVLDYLSDKCPQVRSEAIETLTHTLSCVQEIPASDNNVFADYIMPAIVKLVNDRSSFVRMKLAANLCKLTEISVRFTFALQPENSSDGEDTGLKETELKFQMIISYILTDMDNAVRRTLLTSNISKLCVFLGVEKTNDVILSHIITFLNDKADFELRCCFFENIVPITTYLGSECSTILRPLLQQGLSDVEENVIHKTLTALTALTEINVLKKSVLYELMKDAIPLFAHPNLWIRHSLTAFVTALSNQLSPAEVNCKLIPLVRLHLARDLYALSDELLLDSLRPPINRTVYSLIIKSNVKQVELLYDCLHKRKLWRSLRHPGEMDQAVDSVLYKRLSAEKIDEIVEEQLLSLKDIVLRICKNLKGQTLREELDNGPEAVTLSKKNRRLQNTALSDDDKSRHRTSTVLPSSMNEEWRHMFGRSDTLVSGASSAATLIDDTESAVPIAREALDTIVKDSIQCPPCANELSHLINHKKDNYELCQWSEDFIEKRSGTIVKSSSRPRGALVAHLHEHSKGVNRLLPLGNSPLFMSCAADGQIKTWDASKIEASKSPIHKSKQSTPSSDSSSFEGMAHISSMDILLSYTSSSVVHVHRIDSASTRLRLVQTLNMSNALDSDNYSTSVTDMVETSPFGYMLSFSNSSLYSYDMRTSVSAPAAKLNIDLRDGFITCIDGNEYSVFAATSSGAIYTFDIRFAVKVNVVRYEDRKRIRRLLFTQRGLFSAVKSNNEVTLFDCESSSRLKTLWASKAPALSKNASLSSPDSVLGMVSMTTNNSNGLITCGSDMRIRYWDLKDAANSCVLTDGLRPNNNQVLLGHPSVASNELFNYSSKFVDGIEVFMEMEKRRSLSGTMGAHSSNGSALVTENQAVSTAHKDCITDIMWSDGPNFLISGSKDGVIKLWR
ncbi:Phosphoinositide 3-kinase regulatory subunit 4 [Halotydeus destructor]|nr:Phosphoinositide 3-kinase regulatory subunit 4 [Halotydeus destructor]